MIFGTDGRLHLKLGTYKVSIRRNLGFNATCPLCLTDLFVLSGRHIKVGYVTGVSLVIKFKYVQM